MSRADETVEERLARWEALADSHEAKFDEAIRLAGERPGDDILAGIAREAEAGKRGLAYYRRYPAIESPYGALGWWGSNGQAPRVDDLLSRAKFHHGRTKDDASSDNG